MAKLRNGWKQIYGNFANKYDKTNKMCNDNKCLRARTLFLGVTSPYSNCPLRPTKIGAPFVEKGLRGF